MLKPRINNQILAPRLRVVDEAGNTIGIMSKTEALALTKPTEGLDLIEVVASADPPVARLMSYDKYRYIQEKAEKKERMASRAAGLKQVQISVRAAQNDLLIKLRQLEEFLAADHPVEIQMRMRGREKGNKDWALQKMNDFLQMIQTEYKIVSPPKFGGRGIQAQIVHKK